MNRSTNKIILICLLLISGIKIVGQNPYEIPVEGSTHSYTCNGITEGSNYTFYVTTETQNQTGEYDFIGSESGTVGNDGLASVRIQWNEGSALSEYEVWLEVNLSGCSNTIFIEVLPQPNNRAAGFYAELSNSCYEPGGNGFELPLSFPGNNSEPLSETYFPLNVEFTVNGKRFSQSLEYNSQLLQIADEMVYANPSQDTQVFVEITKVTDKFNAAVRPEEAKKSHIRTIFAIPEIEFSQKQKEKQLNEEIMAHIADGSERLEFTGTESNHTWYE